MRRQFTSELPLLMRTYGLRPWELDDLTRDELAELLRAAWRKEGS